MSGSTFPWEAGDRLVHGRTDQSTKLSKMDIFHLYLINVMGCNRELHNVLARAHAPASTHTTCGYTCTQVWTEATKQTWYQEEIHQQKRHEAYSSMKSKLPFGRIICRPELVQTQQHNNTRDTHTQQHTRHIDAHTTTHGAERISAPCRPKRPI